MIESVIAYTRAVHPEPWTFLELYLVIAIAGVTCWLAINWTLDILSDAYAMRRLRRSRRYARSQTAVSVARRVDRTDKGVPQPAPHPAVAAAVDPWLAGGSPRAVAHSAPGETDRGLRLTWEEIDHIR